jgi:predicted dinucleotide-binding enzyme
MKVAIIGNGNVGSALARGLSRGGHDVEAVGNEPERMRQVAVAAEVVVLAVPFGGVGAAAETLGGALNGKVLVDVSNALTDDFQLAIGFDTSGAEQLQARVPAAKVVKAFNTVFAGTMDSGHAKGQKLTVFAAGDDDAARDMVLTLARSIGFDAVGAGPLRNARLLEPLGYLNIQLGYTLEMGTAIGFRLVH